MAESNQHNLNDDSELSEAQLLVSAIADGEASGSQRARFEELAAIDASLWRELASEQQAMSMLEADLERSLDRALRVQLPAPIARREATTVLRFPWVAAGLGWAAVIVLAIVWMTTSGRAPESNSINSATPAKLPPAVEARGDDALDQYLQSPWVRGQMQPMLLDIETLPDGAKRLWILRRIEEYVDLPADALLPVDEKKEFTKDPADLRDESPQQTLGTPRSDS